MGVSRDASQEEVKRSYRKLAHKYHPDVSKEPDAEKRFKEMGEAYEVLKDPEKRAAYDQLGADWKAGQEFSPPPGWDAGFEFRSHGFGGPGSSEFSDFFDSLFGRGFGGFGGFDYLVPAGHARQRDEDHRAKRLIDISDAFLGADRSITLRSPEEDGRGRVTTRQRTLNVHIPKGGKQGQQIRLAGQGSQGVKGGGKGDLYLGVEFNPHPFYRVEDKDIHLNLPVSPWEAALGANPLRGECWILRSRPVQPPVKSCVSRDEASQPSHRGIFMRRFRLSCHQPTMSTLVISTEKWNSGIQ